MSTALTNNAPQMVDSLTLRLYHASRAFQSRVADALVTVLQARGHQGLGAGQLAFLAELDCGANHAAEMARRAGVSRQAVHKQVKELVARGLLEFSVDDTRRNQKVISFTTAGTALMAECRQLLAEMDDALTGHRRTVDIGEMIDVLAGSYQD